MIDAYVKGFSNFVYTVWCNFRVLHQHDCWSLMKTNQVTNHQVHHYQIINCFNNHQLWYEGDLIKSNDSHFSPSLPHICVESIGFIPLIFIEPHLHLDHLILHKFKCNQSLFFMLLFILKKQWLLLKLLAR